MKKITKTWVAMLMFLPVLISCREELDPEPFTYTKLLTGEVSKTWRMTGISILEEGEATQNIPLPDEDCVFDDEYIFYANDEKKYEILNGPLKCDEEETDVVVTDRWAFSNANATLEIILPILSIDFTLPFIVKSLTEERLVIEIFFDGGSYRFSFQPISNQE